MIRISFFHLISLQLIVSTLSSCTNVNSPVTKTKKAKENSETQPIEKENADEKTDPFDMSNPAFMMGTNLGDYSKMLTYTSSATIKKYGKEKLLKIYRNLDLGHDMKLTNMTSEVNEKILHYEIVINATKQVKRLHVVIENDTARVVPQHLERGEIFE